MSNVSNPQTPPQEVEALVLSAKGGDKQAVVKLLLHFTPMVRARARFYAPGGEEEDYFQEGMLSLCSAIDGFDDALSSFPTFARLCVDRRLISLLRRRNLKKHIPAQKRVPLEDIILSHGTCSAEESFISREDHQRLMQEIRKALSPFEFTVLKAYLDCGSAEEVSRLSGSNTKAVNNALCRIRAKLKKYKMPK